MLALTSATLFTKNKRKLLQSSLEQTGAEGTGELTRLFMVLNKTLGFFFTGYNEIREIGSPSIPNHVIKLRQKIF